MLHRISKTLQHVSRKVYPIILFSAFLTTGFVLHVFAKALVHPTKVLQNGLTGHALQIASAFHAFAPSVKTHADETYFYVESNGMPDHRMMVGIKNWQQQVPLPQSYVGQNAWQFPLHPTPAANPMSGKTHFFRGAMAIAADGVPIFNALNNRGGDSNAIGELDEFGGHCGRADDYHYHIAPTYLQKIVGKDKPIGYALDGYALYGLTEPDGSPVGKMDEFNGHTTAKLGYHYHATNTYPYLNGGFHGEVVERDGQVDPQPRAQPIRPATRPLRGAQITGFVRPSPGSYSLTYTLDGETNKVNYSVQPNGSIKFDYIDGQGHIETQTYDAPPNRENGPPPRSSREQSTPNPKASSISSLSQASSSTFILRSPSVGTDGVLPAEFTGDGSSISPPLSWTGAPAGTKSFAVIMHHIDPQGVTKWYWTFYHIPASVQNLPKNVTGIGTFGNNSINDQIGYAPPHSKGPGPKTYIITLYALSEAPKITVAPYNVSRAVLLDAMKGHILATSELRVVYTRPANAGDTRPDGPPPSR